MPNLTDAELRLLSLLTWKTRAAADVQLASVVGITDSERPAFVRRLKQLARRGFLSRHCVSIALLVPEAPLVNWLPDLPEADWQAVAWKLQHRWNELSGTRVWINVATRQAASVVGGVGGRLRQPMQLQHDLAMTGVYLVRQSLCVPGEIWIGEDAYRLFPQPKARIKVPDALIVDHDYQTRRVIELGGLYGPRRLKGFHRHWASRRTPYEIW